jgi:putative DNA primase/helicase
MLNDEKLALIDAQAAGKLQRWAEADNNPDATPAPARQHAGPEVQLTQASQLKIVPIRWLWPGWLARGKFHVLAGTPGTGKTTIAMAVAATCTINGRFPDGSVCRGGNVLIWTGEDDPADTLAPRLLASGADLSRVYFIQGTTEHGELRSFDPAKDLHTLERQAQVIGNIALMIVDPIVSAIAGDGHKAGDVRRGLQPLVDLASTLDCAAVGITHFSKGTAGRDPLERVTGSQAFGALARVVIVAAKDGTDSADGTDTPARRFIARAKSNIGPDGGGFDYRLEQSELADHPGLTASHVTWGTAIEGSARDLLGAAEVNEAEGSNANEGQDAVAFLESLLADGPLPVRQIRKDATGAGYAWRTIERAKKKAGVEAQKVSMAGGWAWALKGEDRQSFPKYATQLNDGLRTNVADFDEKDASLTILTEPKNLATDDAEVF